jgi:hypothetical protein
MDIENEQRRCETQVLTAMACLFFCVRLCMYLLIKNLKRFCVLFVFREVSKNKHKNTSYDTIHFIQQSRCDTIFDMVILFVNLVIAFALNISKTFSVSSIAWAISSDFSEPLKSIAPLIQFPP